MNITSNSIFVCLMDLSVTLHRFASVHFLYVNDCEVAAARKMFKSSIRLLAQTVFRKIYHVFYHMISFFSAFDREPNLFPLACALKHAYYVIICMCFSLGTENIVLKIIVVTKAKII